MPTVIFIGIHIRRAKIFIETSTSSRELKLSTQEKNFWKINIPTLYNLFVAEH